MTRGDRIALAVGAAIVAGVALTRRRAPKAGPAVTPGTPGTTITTAAPGTVATPVGATPREVAYCNQPGGCMVYSAVDAAAPDAQLPIGAAVLIVDATATTPRFPVRYPPGAITARVGWVLRSDLSAARPVLGYVEQALIRGQQLARRAQVNPTAITDTEANEMRTLATSLRAFPASSPAVTQALYATAQALDVQLQIRNERLRAMIVPPPLRPPSA